MLPNTSDVLIVGGGIMGLSQAWFAARAGKRVTVLERQSGSLGASARNFGMIWPIGQPDGDRLQIALQSRDHWLELARQTGIYLRESGALFAAIDHDEAAVMEEFVANRGDFGYDVRMLTAGESAAACKLVRSDRVRCGLLSETELNVDPRQALPALAKYLTERYDVRIHWNTTAVGCEPGRVDAHDGRQFSAEQILVCQGHDAAHLFPQRMSDVELQPCKLHMLRTLSGDALIGRDMGAMLASGLTLRHYPSFAVCDSLSAYQQRLAVELPHLDRYGIHVMASQDSAGRLILGDSHQYGGEIEPFHDEAIDRWILEELEKRITLPDDPVDQRWQGYYLKRRDHGVLIRDPCPGVRIVNGLGGNGMTLSFGIAARMWQDWNDETLLAGLPESNPRVENAGSVKR
jgi:FAD dependent oxidoreductase TIGR03364